MSKFPCSVRESTLGAVVIDVYVEPKGGQRETGRGEKEKGTNILSPSQHDASVEGACWSECGWDADMVPGGPPDMMWC